jgi:membrane-bound serine protease (ClpP class)
MLGVYIEFNTPGVGLPGLAAVICFTIIIGSKYLVGMANWVEVALFVVGMLLLIVEIFVLPGFGIAGFLGIICILAGLFGMLIKNPPDKLPWPQSPLDWEVFLNGVVGLSLGFVGFLIAAWFLVKYLPKLQFLSGLMLAPAAKGEQLPVSMTAMPQSRDSAVNIGDVGVVVSPLRPAGRAKFDQAVVDVVTEGEFIENGVEVKILEIHGNRVVVRTIKE